MKNIVLSICSISILSLALIADDYSFDMDEIETIKPKNYEYSGYIKTSYKYQELSNSNIDNYYGEAMFRFKYFKNKYTLYSELMGNYENQNDIEDDDLTTNQLYLNYKIDDNNLINIGKLSSKWSKGYFFNPVGFIDRKKDPYNPEIIKEGYSLINYRYNKVYNSKIIKNILFDLVYLKTSTNTNNQFYNDTSNNFVLKYYTLLYDTDIDFVYLHSDKQPNKIGFDFATNIETNFELHGEISTDDHNLYSYLLGIKYLTITELTITTEYFYQNKQLNRLEPFWDNRYLVTKLSQKEPFDILYMNLYYKNSLNIKDHSYQQSIGFIYDLGNNFQTDISIGENNGDNTSEYGMKKTKAFTNFEIKYNF